MGPVAETPGDKLFAWVALSTGEGVVVLPSILHPDRGLRGGCATALKHRQLPHGVSLPAVKSGYHLTNWDHWPDITRCSLHKVNHSWTEMTRSPLPLEHPPFLQEGFSQGALKRVRKRMHCSGAFQQRQNYFGLVLLSLLLYQRVRIMFSTVLRYDLAPVHYHILLWVKLPIYIVTWKSSW